MTSITVKCQQCGSTFDIESKEQITGFVMKCAYCGKDITTNNIVSINTVEDQKWQGIAKPKSHKGLWTLLVFVLAVVALVFTKPDREKHVDKIKDYCMAAVNENTYGETKITKGLTMLLGPYLLTPVINSLLTIDDYVVMNVGTIKYEGRSRPVTIGILGTIIPLVSENQLKEAMDKPNLENNDYE